MTKNSKNTYFKAFSLIEILVVVSIFVVLAVIMTQSISTSLRGSKKTESSIVIRENLNYALSVMERQLLNARYINSCTDLMILYQDELNRSTFFQCFEGPGNIGYIASASAAIGPGTYIRITSPSVDVDCSGATQVFRCSLLTAGTPQYVDVTLSAVGAGLQAVDTTGVTVTSRVLLRTYERF